VQGDIGALGHLASRVEAAGWRVLKATTVRRGLGGAGVPLRGAIIDLSLPDGSGFDVIEAIRSSDSDLPILVLSGSVESADVNRSQYLGAEYCYKPLETENLRGFLRRCHTRARSCFSCLVERKSKDLGLTPQQRRALECGVASARYAYIAQRMGISMETVKTHVGTITKRSRKAFEDLVAEIRESCIVR
jgi:DNA-binding NarL/FixJ family response regulator